MTHPTPFAPPPRSQLDGPPADLAEHIDELMAQPVKGRPQITVVGDDAVFGINPLPTPPKTDA